MIDISCNEEFDFRSAEYAELFRLASASAFQHPLWLDNFYEHMLAPSSASAQIVEFRSSDKKLLGVVPLILRRKSGLILLETTDLGVSDYSVPVLSPAIIDALEKEKELPARFKKTLPPHDVFRVRPVREEHAHQWALLTGTDGRDLQFEAYSTELGETFVDWSANKLDSSLRKQLQRKQRKLEREFQGELKLLTEENDISKAISEIASMRSGRFETDVIQSKHALDHYINVALSGAESGFAMTYALHSSDGVIGYVFGITHKSRFCYLLIGCDYDKWGKFSPGLLAYTWIIEDWMARGGHQFDFTIGGEGFKHQFGTEPTNMSAFISPASILGHAACKLAPRKIMGEGA